MINSPALIVLTLLPAALLIPVVCLRKKQLAYPIALLAMSFSVFISIVNLVKVLRLGEIHYHLGGWVPPIGIEYVLDPLSAFIALVINVVALVVLFHARLPLKAEFGDKRVPYYALSLLLLCGFNGMIVTGDFFNLYVWLEICSLAGYGLIAVGDRKAVVASFRYLIMGTIGACFYLLGLGFLFTKTGSLNMADIAKIAPLFFQQPVEVVAISMMTAGMAIKMALFPMHLWLPDAYTYASSSSSALIAPIGTKIGAYVIIRIFFFVFGVQYVSKVLPLTKVFAWLSAIAIIFGSVMAVAQKELKRMLAYSSIAQIGYIGLGIGLATPLGLIGAILHLANHAFMKACLFLVSANLRYRIGHSNISKFDSTLSKAMPWTMAAFTAAALSMVGVPPMAGFFSKWYFVLAAIEKSQWHFLVVILISSLLNAVYFFRVIERTYTKSLSSSSVTGPGSPGIALKEVSFSMLLPVLFLAACLFLLGIFNAFIVKHVVQYIVPISMKGEL